MTGPLQPNSEHLASGYVTTDKQWRITGCNRKAALILGMSREELLDQHCSGVFAKDRRFEFIGQRLAELSALKGASSLELTLDHPYSGQAKAIRVRIITLPDPQGGMNGAVIGFADLGEPLAASRMAVDSIVEGIFTIDRNWRVTSFNRAAEKITGWSEAELLGRDCRPILKITTAGSTSPLAECMTSRQDVAERTGSLVSQYGQIIPIRLTAAPLLDSFGEIIGGVTTFIDITKSLQYEQVLEAVADGVFTVDEGGRITSFNKAAERISGWPRSEVLGKKCSHLLLASSSLQSCPLATCMKEKRSIVDMDLFIIAREGFSIPVTVSAAPFIGVNGEVLGGVETFRDNTHRIQKELILDSVADGVFTVDREWRITSFNCSAEMITGWSQTEAIGRYCSDVFCSSLCGRDCAVAESLYCGQPVTNRSITIKNKKGQKVPVSISAAPLVDHDGNVLGGVEIFRDLSIEQSLRQQLHGKYTFESIISKSPAMQRLFQIMPDIARSNSNVLILGESGTGKELVASAIFHASARRDQPFVVVNCGALPDTLLESELFGYKAGAFTDARKDRPGRFAAAEGGTIFLDEIGDIPQALQVKLLRVLQQKVYEPLGTNTPVAADVRIIAATNRNLPELVKKGIFRDDLFYRLNVVNIILPPLRERIEDIPLLVNHFINKFRAEKQKDIVGANEEVISLLMRHDYPGNIRELENIIEYGFILCPGGLIGREHLPDGILDTPQASDGGANDADTVQTLEAVERKAIVSALIRNNYKRMITCRELGISKDTLRRKIAGYQIDTPDT